MPKSTTSILKVGSVGLPESKHTSLLCCLLAQKYYQYTVRFLLTQNQPKHHKKITFDAEYDTFVKHTRIR